MTAGAAARAPQSSPQELQSWKSAFASSIPLIGAEVSPIDPTPVHDRETLEKLLRRVTTLDVERSATMRDS
ncbi:MAG TPA: hypothetical protein VLN59_02355 [Burkholderiales bacterium]|nr:hypothetical protein [Burkholderiales bacterium]